MKLHYGIQFVFALTLLFAVAYCVEEEVAVPAELPEPTTISPDAAKIKKFFDKIKDDVDHHESSYEHYPAMWAKIDVRPIIDNKRLFNKYKKCVFDEKPVGCPRDITAMRDVIPEVLHTMCAKCLPEHVEAFKKAIEYICQKRRDLYDQLHELGDPDSAIQGRFEAKFGKINC